MVVGLLRNPKPDLSNPVFVVKGETNVQKLILFRLHDKKRSRLIFLGLILVQVILIYWLCEQGLCLTNLPDLLYVPVTMASFIFSLPAAISQGLMAGILLGLAYQQSIGGSFQDVLWFTVQQTMSFISAAAIIGILKNKLERFYLRKEEMFFIDEFTGLPNMSAFNRDLLKMEKEKNAGRQRIILAEIVNQNEISAAFGQPTLFKMQSILQENIQQIFGGGTKVYQIQLNTLLICIALNDEDMELKSFSDPKPIVNVDGVPILINMICGICEYPRDGRTTNDLIKKGYIALQEAHRRNQFVYEYQPSLEVPQKIVLLGQIEEAMDNKKIIFYYQPILNVDGTVHSVEALVRWDHPHMGLLSPSEFIPDLELTGIANHLVEYSLQYNLANLRTMINDGYNFPLAINISITNLQQPEFTEHVLAALNQYDLPPTSLVLEITERGFLTDAEESTHNIQNLSSMGISFHIDDFGVGFTSIGTLRKFGIHSIKIDHSYVTDISQNEVSAAVVECVVSMAKKLGLKTVAEGVEDINLLAPLKKLGVDYFQGYAIARPMPFEDLREWLKGHARSEK